MAFHLRFKIALVAGAPTHCLNSRALSTCITHLAGAFMPIAIIAEKLLGFPRWFGSLKSPAGRAPNTLPGFEPSERHRVLGERRQFALQAELRVEVFPNTAKDN